VASMTRSPHTPVLGGPLCGLYEKNPPPPPVLGGPLCGLYDQDAVPDMVAHPTPYSPMGGGGGGGGPGGSVWGSMDEWEV
jgi:hypothetical protein